MRVAEKIKEDYAYVCGDIVKEFGKYDAEPAKWFKKFDGLHSVTGRVRTALTVHGGFRTNMLSIVPTEIQR